MPVLGVIEPGARARHPGDRHGPGRSDRHRRHDRVAARTKRPSPRPPVTQAVTLTCAACPGFRRVRRARRDRFRAGARAGRAAAWTRYGTRTSTRCCSAARTIPFLARTIGDVMGRDVVLVSSADETAFALKALLEDQDLTTDSTALGSATAGCPRATPREFARLGRRLLGPELDVVDALEWASVMSMTPRHDGRMPNQLRPVSFVRDFTEFAAGFRARVLRPHPSAVHGVGQRGRPALDEGQGQGLGHRRVLDAAGRHARSQRSRGGQGQAEGPHPRDPAPHRPGAARRHRHRSDGRGRDHARLRRSAGRRRHPHRVDLWRLRRAARRVHAARRRRSDAQASADRRLRRGIGRSWRTAQRCSTSTTTKIIRPRST